MATRRYDITLREVTYGHVEVEAETMQDAIEAAVKSPEVDWEDPMGAIPFEARLMSESR
jgi:hypothetical protein